MRRRGEKKGNERRSPDCGTPGLELEKECPNYLVVVESPRVVTHVAKNERGSGWKSEQKKEQGKTEQRVPGWGTPCLKAARNEGDRYCLVIEEEMAIRVVKSGRYL